MNAIKENAHAYKTNNRIRKKKEKQI